MADAKRFWVEFYGVGAGEAAVVGDFDPAEISPVLTELFGTWKSPAPYARIPDLYGDRPAVTQQIETPDKANAIMLAPPASGSARTTPPFRRWPSATTSTAGRRSTPG